MMEVKDENDFLVLNISVIIARIRILATIPDTEFSWPVFCQIKTYVHLGH